MPHRRTALSLAARLFCVVFCAAPVAGADETPPGSQAPSPSPPSPASGDASAPPSDASAPPATLSKAPRLKKFVEAATPASLAQREHVEVKLDIDVDDKGQVSAIKVVESGGAEYDEAALAACKQFQFEPGEAGGKPVPVRVTYTYRFVMKPVAPPPPATSDAPSGEQSAPPAPKANTVPFKGKILRKGDRVPVVGANITIDNSEDIATTDGDGRFSFDALPVGKHNVTVTGPGIEKTLQPEELVAGKSFDVTYYVSVKIKYRSTVRGSRPTREVVEQTLDVDEIKRIPGTQGDALKAVQNLPGVARAPLGGGQIIVWGSSPQDTRTYLDGAQLPILYHFGGLRSTVVTEILSDITFTPGGYGAEYGRGMGGLIEVSTRKPRRDGYHGFVQLDFIDGSFLVEGPISKTLDFSVSARRSWIDAFLPLFTSNDFQLSPKYWDYHARLHWKASTRDDVEVLFFGSDDSVEVKAKNPNPQLSAAFDSHMYYHRVLANWQHRFESGGTLTITPSTGYAVPVQFNAALGNFNLNVSAARIPYAIRSTFRQPLGNNVRLDAGLDFEGDRWSLSALTPLGGGPREGSAPAMSFDNIVQGNGTMYLNGLAPWAQVKLTTDDKKLEIVGGLRLETFFFAGDYSFSAPGGAGSSASGSFNHAYFEPEGRLSARYQLAKWAWIKGAVGYYHQAPQAQDLFGTFGNPDVKPQTASHWVGGFDFKPTASLSIDVEGFYKDIRDLIVRGEKQGDPAVMNDGQGRVYGGQFLVRQQLWKGLFAWLSYTVSRAERKDHPDSDWRLFQYDQTHILTAIASYQFGRGYQIGARFRYVTGNPNTPVDGAYFDFNSGRYFPIYGATYSSRLGSFNQLDIRFDKTWEYKYWKLGIYIDIQNVYNAHNPEGYQFNYDFSKSSPVSGIPFFPAAGVRGDF